MVSKSITTENLIEFCKNELRGTTIATLVVETEPPLRKPKKTGMAGRIKKRSRVNVILNFLYQNSVNLQRERETEEGKEAEHFQVSPRKWGTRIRREDGTLTPLVEHKGQYYLECKIQKPLDTVYLLDGMPVDKEAIKAYLREEAIKAGRQEVKKPVVLRDYKLSSIREIRVYGETFHLKQGD